MSQTPFANLAFLDAVILGENTCIIYQPLLSLLNKRETECNVCRTLERMKFLKQFTYKQKHLCIKSQFIIIIKSLGSPGKFGIYIIH